MRKVLIANRGEIACRIIRSCRALGLATVAVYSDVDQTSLHVEQADAAYRIGSAKPRDSYLQPQAILAAAKSSGADAIHPGYGFLAENADFAKAVESAGLIWIGPTPQSIEDMGDKERARSLAWAAGVPILPGSTRFDAAMSGLETAAEAVGYPLLVKAAAGGGGIGMRQVASRDMLRNVAQTTQALAARLFGAGAIYLERFISRARHVELQVFGFGDGRAVHLFERDCSLQRRYQKIIEESPAPRLADHVLQRMADAAVALAKAARYRGAGTVEFILDVDSGEFFFP